MSVLDFRRLQEELPDARFVDAASGIWSLRMRKSPAEVDCLREACRVTDAALVRLFGELQVEMTERDIARRLGQLLLDEGADRIDWIMMTSGQGQYHRTFGQPRDRRLEPGDMIWMDISAVVNGYRAASIGRPSSGDRAPEQEKLQELVQEATMAGVSAIKPGAACGFYRGGSRQFPPACRTPTPRFRAHRSRARAPEYGAPRYLAYRSHKSGNRAW